ncbi:MAG: PAS domain S-box protein [Gemmatimonadota bacterium]
MELRAPTALLARASTELAAALDMKEAMRSLASIVVPAAADWCAVDLVQDDGSLRRVALEHQDPEQVERVRRLEARYPRDPEALHGAARAIRTGTSELVPEIGPGFLEAVARDAEHLALLRALKLTSYVVVPLMVRGRAVGAMTFAQSESDRRFDDEARLFLEDLADRAALTLDNIRLVDELDGVRRRVEVQAAALATAEEQHREKAALLASTLDGIYGLDRDGRCTFMNSAAAELLGVDPGAARGRNMHRLIHHTRRDGSPYPEAECPIFRAFRQGEAVRVPDEILWRADGSWFPASYSSSPVVRDGEVVGAVVAFTDESERRTAQNRVELLGRILDESLNEIYMFDPDTLCFVQVNRGGRENLGYEMDELRGMTPLDLKPEFTRERFAALVEPVRAGEQQGVRFETVHQRKDGSTYPVEVNLQLSRGGERPLFVAVILDITERRKNEAERERLIAELEEANQVKAEFVSTMSHELRTPLNAVLGYTQLLEDGIPVEIPDEASSHVRRIALSGRHLLQLIDEILTFSKLEAGRGTAEVFPVDLPELLEEVRAVVTPLAGEKAIQFSTRVEALPERFVSDPRKLRQILMNVAGNAVKFTDEGRVDLEVTGVDGGIEITVSDTGVGMSAEEQERAIEPFWQADPSSTREAGGTGLGLAITQRFVDILDGTLRIESERGRGTTFGVFLPSLDLRFGNGATDPWDSPGDEEVRS